MNQTAPQDEKIVDAIPDPPAIRRRLAQIERERGVLRALLRVAELKEREQPEHVGQEACCA